jgi:hypothetical protein
MGDNLNNPDRTDADTPILGSGRLMRAIECGVAAFFLVGLLVALSDVDFVDVQDLIDSDYHYWIGLVTLGAWTFAPLVLRPLSTPGITIQQRYAVIALVMGAGLSWLIWLSKSLRDESVGSDSLGIFITIGLVAIAGFLRLGWRKMGRSRDA